MVKHRNAGSFVCALAALVTFAASGAMAQSSYPDRPVHLVVPYPPGAADRSAGASDRERLGASLKQPVIVDNQAGCRTLVGAEFVAKQPATATRS